MCRLEHMIYKERLLEQGLFSLEKMRGQIWLQFLYMKGNIQKMEVIIIGMWKIHCQGICPLSIYQTCPNPVSMANLVFYVISFAASPAYKRQCRELQCIVHGHIRNPVAELRTEPRTPKC